MIFKHFGAGSALDVVFSADMLDDRGMKRLVRVPIPPPFSVTAASQMFHVLLVLVNFIPLSLSVLVSFFDPPQPLILFLSNYID